MRKICVITGARAEYGLLYWLMKEIQVDPALQLQLVVTGSHLMPEFGETYTVIEADGFPIDAKVDIRLSDDTPMGITISMGNATIGMARAFARLQPDIVVINGDRYEILAAAQAAMMARIPIAHIHGGESAEGAVDESIRHAVTKMAHWHFVSTDVYRRRVIQLGEDPERVWNVGAIGLDNLHRLPLLSREAVEAALDFPFGRQNFLVTYHPVTLDSVDPTTRLRELFNALDKFPEAKVIFTFPNADTSGRQIIQAIQEYIKQHPGQAIALSSLGQARYLSAITHVDVVIGNSSSGLIEVPAMKKPTVNIGERQRGRLRGPSVIDCAEECASIVAAIEQALSSDFQHRLPTTESPYGGDGTTSIKIKDTLKQVSLENVLMKRFYNVPVPENV